MEAIDELEAQGNQQRQAQQQEWRDRGDYRAAGRHILLQAPGGVGDAGQQQAEEQHQGGTPRLVGKLRAGIALGQLRLAGQ
ncbi:hypothetical protein D3C79_608660 [compost metagenome]